MCLVSFGAALLFLCITRLHAAGRIGWIICFMFMACGAELARFNVQVLLKPQTDFVGLPIPMSAAVIAALLLKFIL